MVNIISLLCIICHHCERKENISRPDWTTQLVTTYDNIRQPKTRYKAFALNSFAVTAHDKISSDLIRRYLIRRYLI